MKSYFISTLRIVFMTIIALPCLLACEDESLIKNDTDSLNSQLSITGQQVKAENQSILKAEGRYMVLFKNQEEGRISQQSANVTRQRIQSVFSDLKIDPDSLIHEYLYVSKGFAANLSDEQAKVMEGDPRIKTVVPDFYYQSIGFGSDSDQEPDTIISQQGGQVTPWGISRVGGPLQGSFEGLAQNHRAWVLDTGIDLNHSDLNANSNLSESFVQYTSNPDDDQGHGTHVAGIIAARDNNSDVVGVAPGLQVVAIKVCDNSGGCFVSDTVYGVNYVAANYSNGDLANMSLSWPVDDPNNQWIDEPLSVLENAIEDAADDGLMFSIAAGNQARDANLQSPARMNHNNVWTVSAFRQGDQFIQSFDTSTPNCGLLAIGSNNSNPPIDYSAPGEEVQSLWLNGGTLSTCGTSMAAPHIAGILLGCGESGLDTDGSVSNDPVSPADPIARADIVGNPSNVTHSVVQSPIDPSKESPELDWDALSGATGYEIQRKHWQHDWKLWASPSSTSYTDIMTQSVDLQATTWQPSSY